MTTMMACGHAANATTVIDGEKIPCCAICAGIAAYTPAPAPDLTGREAQCPDCKRTVPSSTDLAFFEYRGPGAGGLVCEVCRKSERVHDPAHEFAQTDHAFVPWVREYDSYYSGCRGWD